jgi:hypothetical protein
MSNLSDDEINAALQCSRAANGIVMGLFEVQNETMTVEEWGQYVTGEADLVGLPALVNGLAYLATAYIEIVSNLTGRTPQELIGLGALGVEIGEADLRSDK